MNFWNICMTFHPSLVSVTFLCSTHVPWHNTKAIPSLHDVINEIPLIFFFQLQARESNVATMFAVVTQIATLIWTHTCVHRTVSVSLDSK